MSKVSDMVSASMPVGKKSSAGMGGKREVSDVSIQRVKNGYKVRVCHKHDVGDGGYTPDEEYVFGSKGEAVEFAREAYRDDDEDDEGDNDQSEDPNSGRINDDDGDGIA